MAITIAGAIAGSGFVRQVNADNEQQLLEAQAAQLLASAGDEWIANIDTVAVIATETDGDGDQVAEYASGNEDLDSWAWGILRRADRGMERIPVRATDSFGVDLAQGDVADRVDDALTDDDTTLLGLLGSGLDRRFVFIQGTPDAEDVIGLYAEISLAEGSADNNGDNGDNPFSTLAFGLYEGTEVDPARQILQFGDTDATFVATEVIDIANTELLLLAGSDGGLSGTLAERLPTLLFASLAAAGLLVAAVNEVAERRAASALDLVADLEDKNQALDRAIVEREEAATRREQAERELWRAQRLEAVGQLAGGVAHDFNNLLAAITSYAELAAENVDDPDIRDDLDQIRNSARRGAGLTRQLLLFARASSDEAPIARVDQVFHDIEGLIRSAVGSRNELVIDLADDLPEVADRALEPFFSTKQDRGESGLGLLTVYGIVTRAGGAVDIDSTVGAGTTIRLSLPVAAVAVASSDVTATLSSLVTTDARCRVLLIDDEDAVRNATARLLGRRGYEVATAGSGREGLALLDVESFDVVVTDLLMPGEASGRTVLDELARTHPSTAAVVITGYSGTDATDDIDAPVLTKPFTDAELSAAMPQAALC